MEIILKYIRIDSGSITLLIVTIVFLMFAISARKEREGYEIRNISGEELHALLAVEKNIRILDVRTKEEYDEEHIDNAINIPIEEFQENIEKIIPNFKDTIVVYCESGMRAKMAVNIMKKKGYKKIYNLGKMKKYFERTV